MGTVAVLDSCIAGCCNGRPDIMLGMVDNCWRRLGRSKHGKLRQFGPAKCAGMIVQY